MDNGHCQFPRTTETLGGRDDFRGKLFSSDLVGE